MITQEIKNNRKIKVRFGKMYLVVKDIDTKEIIKKGKVTRSTEVTPILVLCEKRDWYVRGMGIMLETEDNKRYTFQLASLHNYADPEDVLRLYNFKAIVDYRMYAKILGLIRGWKIRESEYNGLVFAEGSKLIGSGVIVEESEFEYRNCEGVRVPIYIHYPNGYEQEIMYPTYLQIVPYDPRYIYKLEIAADENLVEVENVTIPGFALI